MKSMSALFCLFLLIPTALPRQGKSYSDATGLVSAGRLERLLEKPSRLEGYRTHQTGFLSKIQPEGGAKIEETFTVENMQIAGEGLRINGWLYLPLGKGKVPLIVLTNGGGDDSRPIRNLSDWIAPILAHCGIAAFVHDKRGTGEAKEIDQVAEEIIALRKMGRRFMPVTKQEQDTDPRLAVFRPTWYSLAYDYVTELERFDKKLLAIYGEDDPVVSAKANVKTLIRIDHIVLNWIDANVVGIEDGAERPERLGPHSVYPSSRGPACPSTLHR